MDKAELDSSQTEIQATQPADNHPSTQSESSATSSSATPQYASTTVATVADPRPNNNGPFCFTPDELMDLIDPKSPETLEAYGGIQGVLAGLHADPVKGLSTHNQPLATVVSESEKAESSPAAHGKSTGPVSLEDRVNFFGRNVLPKRKPKSIFQLMWMALQEKILVSSLYHSRLCSLAITLSCL